MTVIQSYLHILRSSVDRPDQLHALDVIERNSNHMLELLNDLLDLSRVESGYLEVQRHRFALEELLGDVAMLSARAHERGIHLRIEPPEGVIPVIESDRSRLRQVLVNLVNNAIRFTEPGGEVAVRVRPVEGDPTRQVFEVEDDGIGLSDEEIDRIFEPFRTNEKRGVRPTSGTGLGLTICRELVRSLGGDIEVESEPGEGAIFRFEIDVA